MAARFDVDRLFDKGQREGGNVIGDRILTIPNVMSLLRLVFLPFAYADLVNGRYVRATVLIGVFSATDFLDGYVARRFDQVSRFGQLLDPVSDRLLIIVVGIAMVRADLLPWWALVILLVRDVVVLVGGALLLRDGQRPPPVTRLGKTATMGLMFTLPTFVLAGALADPPDTQEPLTLGIAWFGYVLATTMYYGAAGQYARAVLAGRREEPQPLPRG